MSDATNIRVKDADGRTLHVSPDVARDGFLKGAYTPVDTRVRVGRGNKTATVDAAEIQSAIDAGWSPVSEKDATSARIRREESTVLGQAQGTAEAFASGLTFGASDYLVAGHLKSKGDTEGVERYRERNKAAGSLADTARVAGEVLPTLFTGGGGAAVKGGATAAKFGLGQVVRQGAKRGIRAAGILPRGVEAVGLAAERGAARVLGEGLGARTVGAFGRGAVEGAAGAVGEEIHESVIGGRDITAERLLAAGGMGALFGGGASAAFPLTGALLKRGGKGTVDAARTVLGKASGMAPEGSIIGGLAQTVVSGKRAKPIFDQASMLVDEASNAKLYRATHQQDEVLEEIGESLRRGSEAYNEAQARAVGLFERKRAENFGDLIEDAGDGIPQRMVADDARDILARLDDHLAVARDKAYSRKFDQLALDRTEAALNLVRDGAPTMSGAKAYHALHGGLREVQEQLTRLRKKGTEPDTESMLVDIENQLKKSLGSEKYGKAADAFKDVSQADALYFQAFDRTKGSAAGRLLDRSKLSTNRDALEVAKSYGDFKAKDRISSAQEAMAADIKALKKRAEYTKDPEIAAAVRQAENAQKKLLAAMDDAAENAQIIGRQREMNRNPLSGALAAAGPSGLLPTAAVLGGIPGMVVGAGISMLARPGNTIRSLAAIRHAADSAGLDIDGIIKRATSAGEKAVGVGARARTRTAVGRGAKRTRGVASRVAGRAAVSRSEDQRAKQRRAEELADPDTLNRELAREMYALAEAAPGIAGAAAEKVGVAAAFLASKLPPESPDPLTGEPSYIDEATRAQFDRYHEAVTDPVATLNRLEDGTFSDEHAEALRVVWPALYEDVRDKVLVGMQEAADQGKRIPYQRRVSLGVLLDLPTDATLTPEFGAAVAMVHGQASAAEAAQGAGPAPQKRTRKEDFRSTTSGYMTPLERLGRDNA